ncbi:tetratricopeptide repeat protein [Longimicrobium sp.]|uniref:tetratricopeptide repeat protein n=1 Tax=Longimicrobium sp. TaxID=2029185 RepID=UPI002E2F8D06|nr:tetratricopeptide repeat protein [Longimicrobium sp.]HEX6037178.1 tetratricopeptide repeat protein [Longimicrobium sp.]
MTARRRPGRPRNADFTAPLTIPGGAVAGADLVRELPAEVSLSVWQTLRSVLLWAAEDPGLRGDLFEPCAMTEWETELLENDWDADVRCPLAVLVGQLGRQGDASAETIAHACLSVTDWALEHGYVATALAYAEAAALSWPQHPRYAWLAGRLMRAHGRPREAEAWLKRAERAANRLADWEGRTLSLNSLGNLYYGMGNYSQAAKMHRDALKVARRHRLRKREGEILHDLFVATWYMGYAEEAEQYARAALEVYKDGHPRLATLAHDVAFSWVAEGYYGRALTVLQGLERYFELPSERIRVLASIARAAGGCNATEMFSSAAKEIWTLADRQDAGQGVAAALVELARGATSLAKWDIAEEALLKAREVAVLRSEEDVVAEADDALSAVSAHRAAAPARSTLDTVPSQRLDTLANGLVVTLRATAVPVAA